MLVAVVTMTGFILAFGFKVNSLYALRNICMEHGTGSEECEDGMKNTRFPKHASLKWALVILNILSVVLFGYSQWNRYIWKLKELCPRN